MKKKKKKKKFLKQKRRSFLLLLSCDEKSFFFFTGKSCFVQLPLRKIENNFLGKQKKKQETWPSRGRLFCFLSPELKKKQS